MPGELWTEVHDILQEIGSKTIPKKKKCKKAKWLFEEALQIAEKKREVKGKRESERYTQLNAEIRRDKKAFLNEQCKEIPEVTGKFGLGVKNEAGQRLIEFCQKNALVIANTFFQQHKRRLYTWPTPKSD